MGNKQLSFWGLLILAIFQTVNLIYVVFLQVFFVENGNEYSSAFIAGVVSIALLCSFMWAIVIHDWLLFKKSSTTKETLE